ncbi:MAG: hypothetical protein ACQEXB_27325 [Bacillota bacterium]
MKNRKVGQNLVTMVQTEEKAKTFRMDYPVSEDLRVKMVNEVFSDFSAFVYEEFYNNETLMILKEFVEESNPSLLKRQSLLDNLFWWQILYQSAQNTVSCVEEYVSMKFDRFRNKPFMTSWLRKCDKTVPNFYLIGEKFTDYHFLVVDLLTQDVLEVFVCHSNAILPKRGEIVAGSLLPLGGGLYFPVVDFYRFDYEAREAICSCFHHHYEKYSKSSSPHETFLHVISVMLQIEKKIATDKRNMSH